MNLFFFRSWMVRNRLVFLAYPVVVDMKKISRTIEIAAINIFMNTLPMLYRETPLILISEYKLLYFKMLFMFKRILLQK